MQGKTVLVTGATSGIGKVTALELARMGAQVVIVGRSAERCAAVVQEIQGKTGNGQVEALVGDLSLMRETRRVAEEFRARHTRLHVLVNNAGAIYDKRQETEEGLEKTFALNHISYFLLTTLLLDLLKASAPARVVNVSSGAHTMGKLDFDDLQNQKNYGMGGFRAYGQSKMMNILFTYELARRLKDTGVTANVLHPGAVATGFGRNNRGLFNRIFALLGPFMLTPERGAETSIYLASSPEVEGVTGRYFERKKPIASAPASYDETTQRRLWEVSEEITGLRETVGG
ncbi:MAG: SDR family oxidoreductase [Anaerolineae bacterium]|nr:SDR family oxidoreductase [Anaerolineae bacterium]